MHITCAMCNYTLQMDFCAFRYSLINLMLQFVLQQGKKKTLLGRIIHLKALQYQ